MERYGRGERGRERGRRAEAEEGIVGRRLLHPSVRPSVSQSTWRNDPLTTGLSQTLRPPESKRIRPFSLAHLTPSSLPPSLYLFSSVSHPGEEERGQAPLISYLITLVMLHIIGKRWAK